MNCRSRCNAYPERCRTRRATCNYTQQYCPKQQCWPCPKQQICPTKQNSPTIQTCPTVQTQSFAPICTSTPARNAYFYLEKTAAVPPETDDTVKAAIRPSSAGGKLTASRPTSAGSAKSSQSKKSNGKSKNASSDSKILKKKNSKTKTIRTIHSIKKYSNEKKESKMDPESVQQLKQDLNTIKEQLQVLTNKENNSSLMACPEMEARYRDLLQQTQIQQNEIQSLKFQNETLREELDHKRKIGDQTIEKARAAKNCLDKYESTLSSLCCELLDSTKLMESKIGKSEDKSSQVLQFGDENYEKLKKKYQKVKDNERKYAEQNAILHQTVQDLGNQLQQSLIQLEMFRKEATEVSMRQQEELKQRNTCYAYQLELKSKEINELSSAVDELKTEIMCGCYNQSGDTNNMTSDYGQLMAKYEEVVEKLKIYEETSAARFQEVQMLKKKEKELVAKLKQLETYTQNVACANNDSNLTITELNNSVKQLKNVVQNQHNELASKDKQIEILLKSEESLKKRIIQLQEQIVSMKVGTQNTETNFVVASNNECSIHLTEELQDLITALYEEIDKALAKDEQIQKQNRNICCLQCVLNAKDKELSVVRKELKVLREQFNVVLKEKEALALQQKKFDKHDEELEEHFSRQCYCEM